MLIQASLKATKRQTQWREREWRGHTFDNQAGGLIQRVIVLGQQGNSGVELIVVRYVTFLKATVAL
jgi:hypothetical protein